LRTDKSEFYWLWIGVWFEKGLQIEWKTVGKDSNELSLRIIARFQAAWKHCILAEFASMQALEVCGLFKVASV